LHIDHNNCKQFKCSNRDITFSYYGDYDVLPNLQFRKFKSVDNSVRKKKLQESLEKKESNRLLKELVNPKTNMSIHDLAQKHIDFMNKIQIKVDNVDAFVRSRKVQIYPTSKQKRILKIWMNDTTFIYNKLVSHFTHVFNKCSEMANVMTFENDDKIKKLINLLTSNQEFPLNFMKLRSIKINEFSKDHNRTPYCIIADIIKEFLTNVKSCITKLKKGQINEFIFKHRKYNRSCISIPLESHYTTSEGFYPSKMGKIKVNEKDFSWTDIKHDYKLIYDKYTKKYYIHVPKYVYKRDTEQKKNIAVMDPGERTFQTLYGLDHVINIGDNMRNIIKNRLLQIDELKKRIGEPGKWKYNKKLKKKTRIKKWKYKRAIDRHHKKIDGIIRELHYKTINYLCSNYKIIMVTDFSSKRVSKKGGNLNVMSKRVLGKLSHYKFRQRLQDKCLEYGCQYCEVNEYLTSKTCSKCGNVKNDLGDAKIYECEKCKIKIGRDVNAAINILIKNREQVII
jgi:transposase